MFPCWNVSKTACSYTALISVTQPASTTMTVMKNTTAMPSLESVKDKVGIFCS